MEEDIAIVFIFRDNKFLIGLRNYKRKEWKNISVWTVPGGRCKDNETLAETLRREVLEEIGITDLVITDYLGKVAGAKDGDNVHVFVGKTKQEPKLIEPEKFSEWKWTLFSNLPSNFINPKVLELVKAKLKLGNKL